jgi:hypothetical protein
MAGEVVILCIPLLSFCIELLRDFYNYRLAPNKSDSYSGKFSIPFFHSFWATLMASCAKPRQLGQSAAILLIFTCCIKDTKPQGIALGDGLRAGDGMVREG